MWMTMRSALISWRVLCCRSMTTEVLPRLTLFSKSGECSLCDQMKEELEPYLHKVQYQEVDINLEENEFWKNRYRYEIPVVHMNGKFLMKHRFDPVAMREALMRYACKTDKD
ncbi:glutaredoxin-like protein C5orf63 homolog [Watersipora subatra]|uniref:glutaredoxin-like protein C5orf63 homolog n=1 Tax=Watersipora subatra TaxID=2589382 RepID=UPI00355C7EFF